MKVLSERKVFGGVQGFYEHDSIACAGPMRFGVFMPTSSVPVPALYFLAGLECNHETFASKAGAQRGAQELKLAVVTCDTSPRAARFPGDDASWDFGQGAGFYVDATRAPWSSAYRMASYVTDDLRAVVEQHFAVRNDARGICGHSMGGHGALTLGLKHRDVYQSVSAIAPICAPSTVPWGQRAFAELFGDDHTLWDAHDTSELLRTRKFTSPVLVDQGDADKFLAGQLRPATLGNAVTLRMHAGYDHSYYFVQSVIGDHLAHHARLLAV